MTKSIRMATIITTTLASECYMELLYHSTIPPSNTRRRVKTIEQIKFVKPTINDKVLMSRKLRMDVNTWKTFLLLEIDFTMALVRNALAANLLPLLSTTYS